MAVCVCTCIHMSSVSCRIKPTNYLGGLLGHEGNGSVLALLKKRLACFLVHVRRVLDKGLVSRSLSVACRNLATGIVAGTGGEDYEFNSCFSLFRCEILLTVSLA